ncbi:MAG: hypothetical protein PHZ26_02625 [Candidatus Gracilibacteria bacterium]|nr:hypothetical protein [Candidatus Gracilibacteria bacterium]MDD2908627.1 hypothetical protein [Candidatus Gracilibacteria bacterium]
MSTQENEEIENEKLDDEVFDIEMIEGLDDLEKKEEEEITGHKLDTRIRENDGEDNYFDETYFE